MSYENAPHRIRVGRVTYERSPEAPVPAAVERLGSDAEGRAIYGTPGRASSRKLVYLAADDPPLLGYVRPDPPSDVGLEDVVQAAIREPLPRPEALAVLGLLAAKHVVLIDGTRLGGPRDVLARAVAAVALEPAGLVEQAARVPDWALLEAARPRWDELTGRFVAVPWVRELADPDFGFIRTITAHELVIGKTTRDPVDVGDLLVVRSQDNSHPDVPIRVREVGARDVRAVQAETGGDAGVAHGDPVYFLAVPRASIP